MVWRTHIGDRILEGVEAEVYLHATQAAVDRLFSLESLNDELDWGTGNRLFEKASFAQKIYLVHTCLSALLSPDIPAPILTHVLEAAAYFPLAFLRAAVEEEITFSEQGGWYEGPAKDVEYFHREMLWKVYEKLICPSYDALEEDSEDEDLEDEDFVDVYEGFTLHTVNINPWETIIESLMERIFWDRDWRISTQLPELLDGIEESFAETTGLTEDYLSNRLPKVTEKEAMSLLRNIHSWRVEISE